jgi:hypothetical protein
LDLAVFFEVGLISHQEDGDFRAGVLVDLFHPVFDVGEGGGRVDGVSQYDDQRTLVEGSGKVFELLLASGVPDLQLDLVLLDLEGFDFEVNSDGRGVGGLKTVVAVAQQDIGLAYPAVSDYHCFDHEVAVCLLLRLHSKIYHR